MARRKCRYGKLKSPRGRRVCRKAPKKASKKARKSSRKAPSKKVCKNIGIKCRAVRPGLPKICVVNITGEPSRTMTSTKAGPFVAKVRSALIARGCKPKISREG